MIAQVVFDLPIDGPFDYLVPEHLNGRVTAGQRVKVSFGPRSQTGFVTGLIEQSSLPKLKPLQALVDETDVLNALDLSFARWFSAYYACSLGEALTICFRHKAKGPSVGRVRKPALALHRCCAGIYPQKIKEIIAEYRKNFKDPQFMLLVPDAYRAETLGRELKDLPIGTRSSVFQCDGRYDCVFMVDDEDASYKQEQSPMYETRQVLLARAAIYGFDVVFVGVSPSVELMALAQEQKIKISEDNAGLAAIKVVDLLNYKFLPGLVSPPLRDALENALKAGGKSILVLNRKGSYRMTRCVDCGDILKCHRCDSPLFFSRSEGKYLCRHCTFTAAGDTVCPQCGKPSWRSVGIGVEQLQTELKKIFPSAKIAAFERKEAKGGQTVPTNFDILISTQAVLRLQGRLKAMVSAFIDFDGELNRLNPHSAFHAMCLGLHIAAMTEGYLFMQTRNPHHYVLESLSRRDTNLFYHEEFKLRKELGFAPYQHWIKMTWRSKSEKGAHEAANQVYNDLNALERKDFTVTPPLADVLARKRDWYRFNVMVQTADVIEATGFIKSALAKGKRQSKVILTLNIDP